MTCLLFVTSTTATNKTINRFLVHFRNWDDGNDDSDYAHLVTTRNAFDIKNSVSGPQSHDANLQSTAPKISAEVANGWAGASIEDVESFVLDADGPEEFSQFIVIDEEGLGSETVVVADRAYDDEAEERMEKFKKARVPWKGAWEMYANLDIANMDFEEYCEEEIGDGWWEYTFDQESDGISQNSAAQREEKIKKLEEQGLA